MEGGLGLLGRKKNHHHPALYRGYHGRDNCAALLMVAKPINK